MTTSLSPRKNTHSWPHSHVSSDPWRSRCGIRAIAMEFVMKQALGGRKQEVGWGGAEGPGHWDRQTWRDHHTSCSSSGPPQQRPCSHTATNCVEEPGAWGRGARTVPSSAPSPALFMSPRQNWCPWRDRGCPVSLLCPAAVVGAEPMDHADAGPRGGWTPWCRLCRANSKWPGWAAPKGASFRVRRAQWWESRMQGRPQGQVWGQSWPVHLARILWVSLG